MAGELPGGRRREEVMDRDARKMRGTRPFGFSCLKTGDGLDQIIRFIEERGLL